MRWDASIPCLCIVVLIFYGLIFFFRLRHDEIKQRQPDHFSNMVGLTLVHSAKDRGAFCLDGSLPAYHFENGYGNGVNSWIIHIEGGGWCNTVESCSIRAATALGSSDQMDHHAYFDGILSHNSSQNPDFYSWNRVKIRYCDGASLAGNSDGEPKGGRKLLFRGRLIWEAIRDELLSIGLSHASQAILSGCSAGGLATLIHCDNFRSALPNDATVKCLVDAGFFLDVEDISGHPKLQSFYQDVVSLQGVAKSLHHECVINMEPSKCFFPHEIIRRLETPVFLVNPAYDFWQIRNVLAPASSDRERRWVRCKLDIQLCNKNQMELIQGFREHMLSAMKEVTQGNQSGFFVNSCFAHCQTWITETWHSPSSPRIDDKTIAESVGEWFFGRSEKRIEAAHLRNPSCK